MSTRWHTTTDLGNQGEGEQALCPWVAFSKEGTLSNRYRCVVRGLRRTGMPHLFVCESRRMQALANGVGKG